MSSLELNSITLGGRIDRLRDKLGYSIEELAERADLNKNTVARLVKGVGRPNLNTFLKLCNALDVTPNDIMGVSRNPDAPYRVFRKTNLEFHTQEPGVQVGILTNDLPHATVTCVGVTISDKSSTRNHIGEEVIICTDGRIGVIIGDRSEELETGDALLFHATEPHSYYNADPNKEKATALCILTHSSLDDRDKLIYQ